MNMSSIKGPTYLKSSLQALPLVSGKLNLGQSRVIQPKETKSAVVADSNKADQPWYTNPKVIGAIATVGALITGFGIAYKTGMFTWSVTPAHYDIYNQCRLKPLFPIFGQPMSYPSDAPKPPAHYDINNQCRLKPVFVQPKPVFVQPMCSPSDAPKPTPMEDIQEAAKKFGEATSEFVGTIRQIGLMGCLGGIVNELRNLGSSTNSSSIPTTPETNSSPDPVVRPGSREDLERLRAERDPIHNKQ